MTSEAIFTAAREAHPSAERIEVKYLLAASAYTIDDGFHDWDEIISHYGDEIGPECRVIEVAVAHLRGGAIQFVFGADVTDAAIAAVEHEESREPWGVVEQRAELGTWF